MATDIQSARVLKRLLAQEHTIDGLTDERTELGKQIGTARKEFNGIMTEGETSPGNEVDVLKRLTTQQHRIDKLVEQRTEVSHSIREANKTFDQIMGEAAETAGGQIDAFKGQTFPERGRRKAKAAKKKSRGDVTASVSKRAKAKAARKR